MRDIMERLRDIHEAKECKMIVKLWKGKRLVPPGNKQEKNVKWAKDYEL